MHLVDRSMERLLMIMKKRNWAKNRYLVDTLTDLTGATFVILINTLVPRATVRNKRFESIKQSKKESQPK